MPSRYRQVISAALALLASSVALYFGTGLRPVWWLMWLAPIPVLLAAPRLTRGLAFATAFLAWVVGGFNMWNYYHLLIEIPVAPSLLIILGPALVFAVAVLTYRNVLRVSVWRAALIFPTIWVAYEFVSERMSPHSTFGNISYSQMNFLPVLQIASITGIWGISYCLFLFAAVVGALLSGHGTARESRMLGRAVGIALMAVLGFGIWRTHVTPQGGENVTVALVASDLKPNIFPHERDDSLRLLREYASQAQLLAAQGARVIVIPEKVGIVIDSDLSEVDSLFRSTAAKIGASIVIGIVHPTASAKWNEARFYSPSGEIRTYEKHHMIPSFESDLTVGENRTVWREPSGLWGIAICKDMDFPQLSREYGSDGSGLLLVPAWDFAVDGWLHGRMAILRGVESGFSIARAAKQGVLTVTDNTGHVLSQQETNSAPFASLVATVPVRHQATIYARFGDWFGLLNILTLVVLVAWSLIGRRRNTSDASS